MGERHDAQDAPQEPPTTSGVPLGGFHNAPENIEEATPGRSGGDDGALEHETAETNTPEDTGSKVEPGRKADRG